MQLAERPPTESINAPNRPTRYRNFVILDVMPLIYAAAHQPNFKGSLAPQWTEQWVSYFSRPMYYTPVSNPVGLDPYQAVPVFCLDLKDDQSGYWRHKYLPTYKSSRSAVRPDIISLRHLFIDTLTKRNCTILAEPGFEADDFAGLLVRQASPNDRFALVTVDGDWSQLVSDHVFWMDTYARSKVKNPYQRCQVLGTQEVLDKWNFDDDLIKAGERITNPHDIVGVKVRLGDASDTILKSDCVDPGIIDLLDPLEVPRHYGEGTLDEVYQKHLRRPPTPMSLRRVAHYDFGVPQWNQPG
jgi:5'-3' exonuclease